MRMQGYQKAPGVHEHKDMRMCGCEDTNKRTEYMILRIREYEDKRLQANTRESEDARVQGCK